MLVNLIIFILSLLLLIKSATWATKHAERMAANFHISQYIVGFIIAAIISILPETMVSINAAMAGIPAMGLGTLLGSNVSDLAFVFAVIILFAGRGIKIQSKIIHNNLFYPFILLVPIILGMNGHYSRLEGIFLVLVGLIFYIFSFKNGKNKSKPAKTEHHWSKNFILLLLSMGTLLLGAHFVVASATAMAEILNISPILIGMLVVGLGTTMPELLFSLKSVKHHHDGLAIGDILGTVLADATIVVGILAIVAPFTFPTRIIYVSGLFMVASAFLLFYFMKSGKLLSRKEALLLLGFWFIFIITEILISKIGN